MEYKNVLLSFEGGIGILAINRPKSLNALNMETLKEIQMAVQEVKDHPEMKVLILTGTGEKAFVAGADITEMKEMNSLQAIQFSKLGHLTLRMIQDLPWAEGVRLPLPVTSSMLLKMQDSASQR
jgi:enoyl-CoA hydratase